MVTAEQLDAYARKDELRELLVSPRYLAGTGLDLDMVIRPLADAGFAQLHGPDGEVFMHSPCHRIRAAFLPEGDDLGLWQIVVAAGSMPMHLPLWKAVFDDGIPAEAVAAFTTALAAGLAAEHDGPEGRPFLYAPFGATPGWYPLGEQAGTAPQTLTRRSSVPRTDRPNWCATAAPSPTPARWAQAPTPGN